MSDATRRTLRTALAVTLAILAALPLIVAEAGLDAEQTPWLASILAVAALVTRIMSTRAVDELLTKVGFGKVVGRHAAPPDGVDG